ncbi:MAG: ester cyclase [Caldilineaceae bacterium]
MNEILKRQRATVDAHIQAENSKDWPAVYDTFIQSDAAYYDVAPLATRFEEISGVIDFYEVIAAAVPDFQVLVTGEYDTPGCLIREVTISGTHQGEYCGVPASGNPVRVELAAFFLFDTGENVDNSLPNVSILTTNSCCAKCVARRMSQRGLGWPSWRKMPPQKRTNRNRVSQRLMIAGRFILGEHSQYFLNGCPQIAGLTPGLCGGNHLRRQGCCRRREVLARHSFNPT